MTRVCIAGAGIAGTYLAIALARRGLSVCLLERRRPDPATGQVGDSGRSIALALSHRGLHALARLGLEQRATDIGRALRGRRIHPRTGPTVFTAYDPTGQGRMYAISRAELYGLLHAAAAEEPGIERCFGEGLADWSVDDGGAVRVRTSPEGLERRFEALIGADGADSSVRRGLQAKGLSTFTQRDFPLVYREVPLRPRSLEFDARALHIWPRGSMMLVGLPAREPGTLAGTLFLSESDDALWFGDGPGLAARLDEAFPDVATDLALAEGLRRQPRGHICTIEGGPWHAGPVGLVGDAAHAITPFLGQGMNCALEDCEVLLEALDRAPDFESALRGFAERRAADARAIGRLSVINLEEMMVHTQTPEYLHRKALEAMLVARFPQAYVPCYTAITFDRVRYARVLRLRELQEALIDRLRGAGVVADALREAVAPWIEAAVRDYGREATEVLAA